MDHDHGDTEEVVCKMNMSFHWGACEFILWKSWQANTPLKFAMACIGFFLLAILYEGLKYYREELYIRSQKSSQVVKHSDGTTTTVKLSVREKIFNAPHYLQTFLHCGQVFISYILMLIVMLCNLYLITAIVLGAGSGYFIFGWLRKISCSDSNECCY